MNPASPRTGTWLVCVLVALHWGHLSQPAWSADAELPNMVILLADDLGWADVSFHGNEIKTPHLDQLVAEGAELSRFYACPVCSPTRAGLMTGRYPIRYGLMRAVIPPWRKGGLDTSEVTLPEVLARAGYRHRGAFGKWHLGHSDVKYHPLRRGFTEFVGHYNGAIDYFTHEREGILDWHRDYQASHEEGYSTDLIADAAVEFIRRHADDPSPFFCYVPFNAPHGPFQAKEEDLQRYEHLGTDAHGPRIPPKRRKRVEGLGRTRRQTLAAMISSLDQGVGRILDTLQECGVHDRTLVWFFSDNGGVPPSDNRPLRGQKATVFEGGIRVVAAVRWPEHVPAGRKIEVPTAYIDLFPTLMEIAGITEHQGKPLDGISMLDVLTGKRAGEQRDLYSYIGQQGEANERIALIEPQWKLVVTGPKITDASLPRSSREIFLFRIAADPYETENVADRHPDVVDRMWNKLVRFRALQPADAVPRYRNREDPFEPLPKWKMPNRQADDD